jgi:5-methylcytosine-specific restriction enzyme subunit McrC
VTSHPNVQGSHHIRRISLHETGPGVVAHLTGDQVAALLAVPEVVKLTPAQGGRWRLAGHRRVGLLRIATRAGEPLELHIKPKIPIPNLLFLLGYAPHNPWQTGPVTVPEGEDLLPAHGRPVRPHRPENPRRRHPARLPRHRRGSSADSGRIRTSRQLRRAGLPLPVSVQYDDHTRDIAENQILLAALYRAAHIPGIGPTSRAQIRHLANRLTGVQPVRPGSTLPPESLLDAVTDLAAEVARDVRSTTASSVS